MLKCDTFHVLDKAEKLSKMNKTVNSSNVKYIFYLLI
jgi:hypothetical protein